MGYEKPGGLDEDWDCTGSMYKPFAIWDPWYGWLMVNQENNMD